MLFPGETLTSGQYLESQDGKYTLIMQEDNNLVMYDVSGKAIWHTETDQKGMKPAYFTNDCSGTIKVVDNAGTTLWSRSKTSAHNTPTHLAL